jgi:hypothetical protein
MRSYLSDFPSNRPFPLPILFSLPIFCG